MRITKLGHACLLVEEGDARLLLDPGTFSAGFEELDGLSAVLVTHQHADHLDLERLPALLERNRQASLVVDEASAGVLHERGIPSRAVRAGDVLDLGVTVEVVGREHAVIHPDIPVIPNVGYLVADRLFHPGDALNVPEREVEILAMPAGAPWTKAAEVVDYVRAVTPSTVVPIHEAVLTRPQMVYSLVDRLAPAATTLRVPDHGEPLDV